MTLALITPPAEMPVNPIEVAEHLRLDHPQDAVIDTLIGAATSFLDGYHGVLGRALMAQTWEQRADAFPAGKDPICLQLGPLVSVTSVKYLDTNGAEQTWASTEYVVDLANRKIVLGWEKAYPATRAVPNAVTVRFVAGTTQVALSPADKLLVLALVAHWHEHREPVVVGGSPASIPHYLEMLIGARREWRVA